MQRKNTWTERASAVVERAWRNAWNRDRHNHFIPQRLVRLRLWLDNRYARMPFTYFWED